MLVTNDLALADKCRSLRNLAFQTKKRFYHEALGWNFRMSNLQAAVGLAQLEKLDAAIAFKRQMGAQYQTLLAGEEALQLPLANTPYAQNIYWVFGVVLKDKALSAQTVMQQLHEAGIGTRAFFYPMHWQPVLQKLGYFKDERYPVAENLSQQGFYLPSGLGLTEKALLGARWARAGRGPAVPSPGR